MDATIRTHLLEINLISAQDLPRISKSMKTYAVAWLNPNRKHTTLVDSKGNANPFWNEKLFFQVDTEVFYSEKSFLTVEIYTAAWFRDVFIGIVKIPVIDLVWLSKQKRFVTLQVRRPSGEPQGVLNIGFSLGGSHEEHVPGHKSVSRPENVEQVEELNEEEKERRILIREKILYWRSRAEDDFDDEGSVANPGSMVNGADNYSDIGPSASVVAAEMARMSRPTLQGPSTSVALPPKAVRLNVDGDDLSSLILEELTKEEALARGWMKDLPAKKREVSRNRRHSDGGNGMFSCFGTVLGIEVQIVCGNKSVNNSNKKGQNKNRTSNNVKPRKSM